MTRIFKALSDGRFFMHIGLEEAERDAREACVEVDPVTLEPVESGPVDNTPNDPNVFPPYAVVYPFAAEDTPVVLPEPPAVDAAGGIMPDAVEPTA